MTARTLRPNLHVAHDEPNHWEVWLDTEIADFDGLCVGCGPTLDEAIADAVAELERAVEILQSGDLSQQVPA